MNMGACGPLPASSGTAGETIPLGRRLEELQLRLSIDGILYTAVSSPLWAAIMAALFGGVLPHLGKTPASRSWPWIVLCAVVAAAVLILSRTAATRARQGRLYGTRWKMLVACAYFAVALSWCLVSLVFWEPDNVANHSFLLVVTIAAVSLFLPSRSGQFGMVLAATLPNLGMIWAQFLRHNLAFDTIIALLLPAWAIQLHIDSWRGCRVVTSAHRTKLEMEGLVAQLAIARDEAAGASRAKSLFLANMSHELRTPLNAIIGFAEIISTNALGQHAQERYREYMRDILRSGRHLLSLITDVLDIAKIEAGKVELEPKWLDGDSLLCECAGVFSDWTRRSQIALRTSVSPQGLRMFADERGFRQIVLNLLSNAIKATPAGGRVEASIAAVATGVTLRIRDTGRGIPADDLARIFLPFEQVDNHYGRANGGTGLGLTLVRVLSELHGGNCRIESEVGTGTEVTVFFPHAKTASTNGTDIAKIDAA
jgi:two-component system, cell cycle sensor histidine kinase PleC